MELWMLLFVLLSTLLMYLYIFQIHFYTMSPLETNEYGSAQEHDGGETELENIPAHCIEIRRKDLLPLFDHFHSIQADWSDRYCMLFCFLVIITLQSLLYKVMSITYLTIGRILVHNPTLSAFLDIMRFSYPPNHLLVSHFHG